MPNTLYLIPTPISESYKYVDATLQKVIQQCDVFIVEQLKTARRCIKSIQKDKNIDACLFIELDKHNNYQFNLEELYVLKGKHIGLLSEAGMPCIADPGSKVVALAHELKWKVVPLVGPSSLLLALAASGFNGQHFTFVGYLPLDAKERKATILHLEQTAKRGNTQLFMDTPYRNQKVLEELLMYCKQDTLLCIAIDITATTESIATKTIAAWKQQQPNLHKKPCIFVLGR